MDFCHYVFSCGKLLVWLNCRDFMCLWFGENVTFLLTITLPLYRYLVPNCTSLVFTLSFQFGWKYVQCHTSKSWLWPFGSVDIVDMWSLFPLPITLPLYRCLVPNCTYLVFTLSFEFGWKYVQCHTSKSWLWPFTSRMDMELVWIATERKWHA